jgi:hypothetical protein
MLDNLDEFIAACRAKHEFLSQYETVPTIVAGDLYCGQCGGPRRVRVVRLWTNAVEGAGQGLNYEQWADPIAKQLTPSLFLLVCLQCSAQFAALIYASPQGPALAILPDHYGGLSTAHTPDGVGYYLDQAHRSRSVGANSAAISMFRAALEFILFEQGFTARMLGPKIAELEAAIAGRTAPKWAMDLDAQFLKIIKRLGDGSIHPNDGDIARQAAFDTVLLIAVDTTFAELLFSIYERQHDQGERLNQLKAALDVLEATPQPAATAQTQATA